MKGGHDMECNLDVKPFFPDNRKQPFRAFIRFRIEQLNKKFKSQFLISEAVFDNVKDNGHDITFKGDYELKGISKKVNIYQLV